jgi:ankyrin repeat protein
VAAEFAQAQAAEVLLEHGADVPLLDLESAVALSWAAFFGRPQVVCVLLAAGLDCALGGAQGQWKRFSNASLEDWHRCVELLQRS